MLGLLVYEHDIAPHVTVVDKSARKDGTFSRETSITIPPATFTSALAARR